MKVANEYFYLMALLGSIFFPLVLSFDRKVNFKQYFPTLIKSVSLVGSLFILGDVLYTYLEVWGFNPEYHLPAYFINLPWEEVGFFLVIPFACVFIYEVVRAYFKLNESIYTDKGLLVIGLTVAILALVFTERLYTTATYSFTALIRNLAYWVMLLR